MVSGRNSVGAAWHHHPRPPSWRPPATSLLSGSPRKPQLHLPEGNPIQPFSLHHHHSPLPQPLHPTTTTARPNLLASFMSIIDPFNIFWRRKDYDDDDMRRRLMMVPAGETRQTPSTNTVVQPNLFSSIFGGDGRGGGGELRRRGMVTLGRRREAPSNIPHTPTTTPSPSPPLVYFPEGGSGECQDFVPSGFNTYSFLSFLFSVANLVGLVSTKTFYVCLYLSTMR